jgi:DNA-binding transcriptional LysR family regulator
LRRGHPHLELVIDNSRGTPEILAMVRQDRLDIALVGGPVTGTGLRTRGLSTTRLGVLLLDGHPHAGSSAVSVRALGSEHLVLPESTPGWSLRRMVEDVFDAAGVSLPEVTTVADSMTMLAFVGAGLGVGFGSLSADVLTPRGLTLVPLAEAPDIATSLVWRDADEPPALRTVIRAAERHLVRRRR